MVVLTGISLKKCATATLKMNLAEALTVYCGMFHGPFFNIEDTSISIRNDKELYRWVSWRFFYGRPKKDTHSPIEINDDRPYNQKPAETKSSPRMRGTRTRQQGSRRAPRIIPAHARMVPSYCPAGASLRRMYSLRLMWYRRACWFRLSPVALGRRTITVTISSSGCSR